MTEAKGIGAAITASLPRVLSASLGPLLRARGAGDPGFLNPHSRSHADAMAGLTVDHWSRLIDAYGLRERGSVLDVACGSGDWLPALAAVNDRVVGVDLDEAMLAHARARAGGTARTELHAMPAESLSFKDHVFDAVACMSALPYLDQAVAVPEMARVLKPEGRLVIGTVGPGYYAKHIVDGIRQGEHEAIAYGIDPLLVTAGRRLRGQGFARGSLQAWSPRAARRLLEHHGFAIERVLHETDAIDPRWPAIFLGRPVYYVVLARRTA